MERKKEVRIEERWETIIVAGKGVRLQSEGNGGGRDGGSGDGQG